MVNIKRRSGEPGGPESGRSCECFSEKNPGIKGGGMVLMASVEGVDAGEKKRGAIFLFFFALCLLLFLALLAGRHSDSTPGTTVVYFLCFVCSSEGTN